MGFYIGLKKIIGCPNTLQKVMIMDDSCTDNNDL